MSFDSAARVETTAQVWLSEQDDAANVQERRAPARPANATRSIFHILSGIVSLLFTLVVFTPTQLPWVAGSIAGTFWLLELSRRPFPRFNALLMALFRPIAHASEAHRVNSATWYMTALTLLSLTGVPLLCVVGVSVLAFADPAASFVGRRYGRIVLLRGRTLEGTLGFVLAGTLTTTLALMFVEAIPGVAHAFLLAFAASLTGAIAELLSRRLDDNLTIPLVASATAAILLTLTGVTI